MKHLFLYISCCLWALSGVSCSDKQDLDDQDEHSKGTLLTISGSLQTGGVVYEPFTVGKQIHVYYDYADFNATYAWLQGIYQFPSDGEINTSWTATVWKPKPDADEIKSIYLEDIKNANSGGKYIFTATSYPACCVDGAYNAYKVDADQSAAANYEKSDFLAARAVYGSKEEFQTGGVTLHFRHLLCQLKVDVILPIGSVADGYFPNPAAADVRATLNKKQTEYTVGYNDQVEAGGIFSTTEKGSPIDIKMHKVGVKKEIMSSGQEASCHTFSVIIPLQALSDEKLMSFEIAPYGTYTYVPERINIIPLRQEMITTIRLILLSGAAARKVELQSVSQEEWKDDHADVGDLIHQ